MVNYHSKQHHDDTRDNNGATLEPIPYPIPRTVEANLFPNWGGCTRKFGTPQSVGICLYGAGLLPKHLPCERASSITPGPMSLDPYLTSLLGKGRGKPSDFAKFWTWKTPKNRTWDSLKKPASFHLLRQSVVFPFFGLKWAINCFPARVDLFGCHLPKSGQPALSACDSLIRTQR